MGLYIGVLSMVIATVMGYYLPPQQNQVVSVPVNTPEPAPVYSQPSSDSLPQTTSTPFPYDEADAAAYWAKRIANGFPYDELTTQASPLEQTGINGYGIGTEQLTTTDDLLTNEGSGEGSGSAVVESVGYILPTDAITTSSESTISSTTEATTTTTTAEPVTTTTEEITTTSTTTQATTTEQATTVTETATAASAEPSTFGYGVPQFAALLDAAKDLEKEVESFVGGYSGFTVKPTEDTTTTSTSAEPTSTVTATTAYPYVVNEDSAAAYWATAPSSQASTVSVDPSVVPTFSVYGIPVTSSDASTSVEVAASTELPSTASPVTEAVTTTSGFPGYESAVTSTVSQPFNYILNQDAASAYWATVPVAISQETTEASVAPTTTASTTTAALETTVASTVPTTTYGTVTPGTVIYGGVPANPQRPIYGLPVRPQPRPAFPYMYGYAPYPVRPVANVRPSY